MTKESFISICWRLIPYWLNNWEQQWGAECSSMMFELPHFAVELLVILPCVQVGLTGGAERGGGGGGGMQSCSSSCRVHRWGGGGGGRGHWDRLGRAGSAACHCLVCR